MRADKPQSLCRLGDFQQLGSNVRLAQTVGRGCGDMGIPDRGNARLGQHPACELLGSCFDEHD